MRAHLPGAVAALAALAVVLSGWTPAGLGLRVAFVLASAPAVGAVPLLAIARLTGAEWPAVARLPGIGWLLPVGVLAMLAPTGVPLPDHLSIWSHPLFAAVRAGIVLAALGWAGARLRRGAGASFAGLTLAIYAWGLTPIAADWLLPAAPGHPVSAVGMMLFLVQFAAACALGATLSAERARQDLALLLLAAAIGLCYLGFMDYLITWFGNLPTRVPFYLARPGWPAVAAMIVGVAVPIAAVAIDRVGLAAGAAAGGLLLFALWWIGGGPLAAAATLVLVALTAWGERERVRG